MGKHLNAAMDELATFVTDYQAWRDDKQALYAAEEEGDIPSSSDWQDNDDLAFDLLERAAHLLGIED